jgi:hypothetical protein
MDEALNPSAEEHDKKEPWHTGLVRQMLSCLPYFALSGIFYLLLLDERTSSFFIRIFDVLYFIFPFGATSTFFALMWVAALLICTAVRIFITKRNYTARKRKILFLLILPLISFSIFYVPTSCKREYIPYKFQNFGFESYIGPAPNYKGVCEPFGFKFEVSKWMV